MSAHATKPRYPREAALVVAGELCSILGPACARLAIAGSLRRGKDEVGDVELLFVPRFEDRPLDLLEHGLYSLAEEAISRLVDDGTLTKRPQPLKGAMHEH